MPPISQTIQVRGTIHSGSCWISRDELTSHILTPDFFPTGKDLHSSALRALVAILSSERVDRDGLRERVKGICAISTAIYIYMYIYRQRDLERDACIYESFMCINTVISTESARYLEESQYSEC